MLIWIFIAIVKINISAIKFDEITVTFHPSKPRRPIIITTEKKQLLIGTIIQISFLNTNQSVAIINKKTSFNVGNDSFYTSTGSKIGQNNKGNSLVKGMISHEKIHEEIVQLNELPQKNRIAKYHSLYKIDGCEYISIIDKKAGQLSVINSKGQSIFEKDNS